MQHNQQSSPAESLGKLEYGGRTHSVRGQGKCYEKCGKRARKNTYLPAEHNSFCEVEFANIMRVIFIRDVVHNVI